MCLPRICLGVWLTTAILQLVLTAVVYVRRRLLYTGSLHKSHLWALHVTYQITLAIYRALRWSPGHSSEDARSRYIPDTKMLVTVMDCEPWRTSRSSRAQEGLEDFAGSSSTRGGFKNKR